MKTGYALLIFLMLSPEAFNQVSSINFIQDKGGIINGEHWNNAFYGSGSELSVAFGDLDGDGDLDLVQGSRYRLEWVRNIGDRSNFKMEELNRGNIVDFDNKFYNPALVDIDNDNDLDLFCGTLDGTISYWNNSGSASSPVFGTEITNFSNITVNHYTSIAFCDIDNDGDHDLFVGDGDGLLRLFVNSGTPQISNFELQSGYVVPQITGQKISPAFSDIDSDGDFDLFISTSGGRLYYYKNNGTSTVFQWDLVTDGLVVMSTNNLKLSFSDIDNDSDQDMFLTDMKGNFYYYQNTGNRNLPEWQLNTSLFNKILTFGRCSSPATGDIDNDGDIDVLFGTGTFLKNVGSANFPEWSFNDKLSYNPEYLSDIPTLIDIDADNDLDLFYGKNWNGSISFYRNTGSAAQPGWNFVTSTYENIARGTNTHVSVSFCDIDGDNDYDMFVQHCNWDNPNFPSGGDLISYYENTGTRGNPVWSLIDENYLNVGSHGISFGRCTFGDIDKDGDSDCLCGGGHPGIFRLFLNAGNRQAPSWEYYGPISNGLGTEGGSSYSTPVMADLNNDSYPEILSGLDGGGLNIFWNNTVSSTAEIVAPNGGESLNSETSYDINYRLTNQTTGSLLYSLDNGFTWNVITRFENAVAGEYTFTWEDIPNVSAANCLLKIQNESNQNDFDVSDDVFSINVSPNIPASPSGLTVSMSSPDIVKIDWSDNSENETGFKVYRRSAETWDLITTQTTATWSDNTISRGKTYYYKILAFNDFGDSEFSHTAAIRVEDIPLSPTNLSLSIISNNDIKILWSDNSVNEEGFIIERRTSSTDWTRVKSMISNSTSFTDYGLTSGDEYFYRIKSFNSAGESSSSNTVSILLRDIPSRPQNLQAQTMGLNSVRLSWSDMSDNEDGFFIYRKDWNSLNYYKIRNVSVNTISYTDNNLMSGKQYSYLVYAYNSAGSKESNYASATTGSLPNLPSEVKAVIINNYNILLSWKKPASEITRYSIQRQVNSGTWEIFRSADAVAISTDINSLAAGSTYRFRIRAENEYGVSSWVESNSNQIIDAGFSANILVRDKNGYVNGAEIYLKKVGNPAFENTLKTTGSDGSCQLQNLKTGDEILVRKENKSLAYPSNKYWHGVVDNKVYVVYFDNGNINSKGNYKYTVLDNRKSSYDIFLDHPVIGYNLVVSLDFTNPVEDFPKSFQNASAYLYDISDGQIFLNKVYIYENGLHEKDADIKIKNAYGDALRPNANFSVFGIYNKDNIILDYRIKMGRSWSGADPGDPDYDRTIIHEFGHYALGFMDEYISWDPFYSEPWAYRWSHKENYPNNYGFMDFQYESGFLKYDNDYILVEENTEMSSYNDYNRDYPAIVVRKMISNHYGSRKYPCWQWLKTDLLQRSRNQVNLTMPQYDYFENGKNITGDRPGPDNIPSPYMTKIEPLRTAKSRYAQKSQAFKPGNKIFLKTEKSFDFLGESTDPSDNLVVQVPESGTIILHKNKGSVYKTLNYSNTSTKGDYIDDITISETKSGSSGLVISGKILQTNPYLKAELLIQFDQELTAAPEINYYAADETGKMTVVPISSKKWIGQLEIDPEKESFDGTCYLEIIINDGINTDTFVDKITFERLKKNENSLLYNYRLAMLIDNAETPYDQIIMVNNIFANPYNCSGQNLIPVSEMYSLEINQINEIVNGAGLSINYDDLSVVDIDESSIGLFYWNGNDEMWERLDSSKVYPIFNSVSSPIFKEGTYALFATSDKSDVIAPSAISDLEAIPLGNHKFELTWTAPGDDGNDGKAMAYDIRFSEQQIRDDNWDSGNSLPSKIPSPSGARERLQLTLNESILHPYFAIKSVDVANNFSGISNIASCQNLPVQESPSFTLTAELDNQILNTVSLCKDVNATNDFDIMLDRPISGLSNGLSLYSEIESLDKLEVDFRSKTENSLTWIIKAVLGSGSGNKYFLSWDKSSIPEDGKYHIGTYDMTDTSLIKFLSDTTFVIRFSQEDISTTAHSQEIEQDFSEYANNNIQVYPNPAEDFIQIQFKEFANYSCLLRIRDLTGQLLYEKEHKEKSELKTIDVSAFSSGVYIISVSINNCVIHKKIIIR